MGKIWATSCIKCGAPLYFGEFAYKQEVCWDCFSKNMDKIGKTIQDISDKEIYDHMVNVFSEAFGRYSTFFGEETVEKMEGEQHA